MDKQALEAKAQMKNLSKHDKWTNFWYYYKVHVLAAVLVVALVAFTAVECAKNVKYDLQIAYFSTVPIDVDGVEKMTEKLKTAADDTNYNGSTDVYIASCYANMEQATEQTQAVIVKFQAELAAGETMGYIVDEAFLEMFKNGYSESMEYVEEITNSPVVTECLKIPEGKKLYWVTKPVYDREKDKPERVAAHENAVKVLEYIKTGELPQKADQ